MKIAFIALALALSTWAQAESSHQMNDYPPEVRESFKRRAIEKQEKDQKIEQYLIWAKKQAEKEAEELRPERERIEKERQVKAEEERERTEKEAQIRKQQEALEDAARAKEKEATKPKCTNIRFTGVVAATYFSEYIDQVLASRDIEDTLARNPIQCHGRNMFGDLNCTGVAYFKNHKGRITDWNKQFYFIDSPVDFNSGRKNIGLAIRRQDAVCAN